MVAEFAEVLEAGVRIRLEGTGADPPDSLDVVDVRHAADHVADPSVLQCRTARSGGTAGRLAAQKGAQTVDGQRIEHVVQRNARAECLLDLGKQLHRQQQVAATVEEVVLPGEIVAIEQLAPDRAQLPRHVAVRLFAFCLCCRRNVAWPHRAQRLAVELAIGGDRQRVHEVEFGWDHRQRQLLPQEGAQRAVGNGFAGRRHDKRNQHRIAAAGVSHRSGDLHRIHAV